MADRIPERKIEGQDWVGTPEFGEMAPNSHKITGFDDTYIALDPMTLAFSGGRSPGFAGGGISSSELGQFPLRAVPEVGGITTFSERDGKDFRVTLIFPNQSRLIFYVRGGSTETLRLERSEGTFLGADGLYQSVSVKEDFDEDDGQLSFKFKGDDEFYRFRFGWQGQGASQRVELLEAHTQNAYSAVAHARLLQYPQEPQAAEVLHVQDLGWSRTEGKDGAPDQVKKRFEVNLSTGELVELSLRTSADDPSQVEVEETLFRTNATARLPKSKLTSNTQPGVTPLRDGVVAFRVQGRRGSPADGLDVTVPLQLTSAGLDQARYAGGATVQSASVRDVTVTESRDAIPARTGTNLYPTPETADLMMSPPLDEERRVTLTFVGTLQGRTITEDQPVSVQGEFRNGVFKPSDSKGAVVISSIQAAGRRGRAGRRGVRGSSSSIINYRVVRTVRGEFEFRLLLSGSREQPVPLYREGSLWGFGFDAEQMSDGFDGLYFPTALTSEVPAGVDDWKEASDDLALEVWRVFRTDAMDWREEGAVQVSAGVPDLLRVRLTEGVVFLRRAEDDGQVNFELLATTEEGGEIEVLAVDLGDGEDAQDIALEALAIDGGDPFTPWRGRLNAFDDLEQNFDPLMPRGLRATLSEEPDRLVFSLSARVPASNVRGAVINPGDARLGLRQELIVEMQDGRILTFVLATSDETLGLLDLLQSTPSQLSGRDFTDYRVTVTATDAFGRPLQSGRVSDTSSDEWAIDFPDDEPQAIRMLSHAGWYVMQLSDLTPDAYVFEDEDDAAPDRPDAPEGFVPVPDLQPTMPAPAEVEAPAAADVEAPARAPLSGPALGEAPVTASATPPTAAELAERQRFPWYEGVLFLPNDATMYQMRRVFSAEDYPRTGEEMVFVFNATAALPGGANLHVGVPMTFNTRGQWEPDLGRALEVLVSGEDIDGLRAITLPLRVVHDARGWGIQVGSRSAHVLQVFQANLTADEGRLTTSTISGLAAGEVLSDHRSALAALDLQEGALALLSDVEEGLFYIQGRFGDEASLAQVAANFSYVPVARAPMTINGHRAIVELTPGLVSSLPEARFSRLRIQDEDGMDLSFVFQQDSNHVGFVGLFSGLNPIDFDDSEVEDLGDGLFRYVGSLPATQIDFAGLTTAPTLDVSLTWRMQGQTVAIEAIQIGDRTSRDIRGLSFDAAAHDANWIRDPHRNLTEVRINMRRPRRAPPPAPTARTQVRGRASITTHMPTSVTGVTGESATRDALVSGEGLAERVWIGFGLAPLVEGGSEPELLWRFDEEYGLYEPVIKGHGDNRYTFARYLDEDGEMQQVTLPCRPNNKLDSQWVLQHPSAGSYFAANYTVGEMFAPEDRSLPVAWHTGQAKAKRGQVDSRVTSYLQSGEIVASLPFDDLTPNQVTPVRVEMGRNTYVIPIERVELPGQRVPLIVRRGVVTLVRDGEEMGPVDSAYYKRAARLPAALVIEHSMEPAFELRVVGHLGSTRDRRRLEVVRQNRGALAVDLPGRLRESVRNDAGLLLYDMNDNSLREEAEGVVNVGDQALADAPASQVRRLNRHLVDVLTGDRYEVALEPYLTPGGNIAFRLLGVARVGEHDIVDPLDLQVMTHGSRIYVRVIHTGQYLSFNRMASGQLEVTSYGTVLEEHLLRRPWSYLVARAEDFEGTFVRSGEGIEGGGKESKETYTWGNDPRIRAGVRRILVDQLGLEPLMFSRSLSDGHATGMWLYNYEEDNPDADRLHYRRSQTGEHSHAFVATLYREIEKHQDEDSLASFEFQGLNIPFFVFTYRGVRIVALLGPMRGVAFRTEGEGLVEISNPNFLEECQQRLGHKPIPRPRLNDLTVYDELQEFVAGEEGARNSHYRPGLREALDRQHARNLMWELEAAGVTRAYNNDDDNTLITLSELLVPNPLSHHPANRNAHWAFRRLVNEHWLPDTFRPLVAQCLEHLLAGRLAVEDFAPLVDAVSAVVELEAVRANSPEFERMGDVLATLAKGERPQGGDYVTVRDRVLNEDLGAADLNAALEEVYGEALVTALAGQDYHSLQELVAAIEAILVAGDYAEAYAQFQERLANSNWPGFMPVSLWVGLYVEFLAQQLGVSSSSTFGARLISWQTHVNDLVTQSEAQVRDQLALLDRVARWVVLGDDGTKKPEPKKKKSSGGVGTSGKPKKRSRQKKDPVPPPAGQTTPPEEQSVPYTSVLPRDLIMVDVAVNSGTQTGSIRRYRFEDTGLGRPGVRVEFQVTSFPNGNARVQINSATAGSGNRNVIMYDNGAFFVAGRMYQVVYDPVTQTVAKVVGSHQKFGKTAAEKHPDLAVTKQGNVSVSGILDPRTFGAGAFDEDYEFDESDPWDMALADSAGVSFGDRVWSGEIDLFDLPVPFDYNVIVPDEPGTDVVIIREDVENWEDELALAEDHGMIVILLIGTGGFILERDDYLTIFEQERLRIATATAYGSVDEVANDLELLSLSETVANEQQRFVSQLADLFPREQDQDLYLAAWGVEIDPRLVRETLEKSITQSQGEVFSHLWDSTLDLTPFDLSDDLAVNLVSLAKEHPELFAAMSDRVASSQVDVFEAPEELLWEILRTESVARNPSLSYANVQSRQAFARDYLTSVETRALAQIPAEQRQSYLTDLSKAREASVERRRARAARYRSLMRAK